MAGLLKAANVLTMLSHTHRLEQEVGSIKLAKQAFNKIWKKTQRLL